MITDKEHHWKRDHFMYVSFQWAQQARVDWPKDIFVQVFDRSEEVIRGFCCVAEYATNGRVAAQCSRRWLRSNRMPHSAAESAAIAPAEAEQHSVDVAAQIRRAEANERECYVSNGIIQFV